LTQNYACCQIEELNRVAAFGSGGNVLVYSSKKFATVIAAMSRFSGALQLTDLDDFITPSQVN